MPTLVEIEVPSNKSNNHHHHDHHSEGTGTNVLASQNGAVNQDISHNNQNETTFDDSATVLSRNLLDESTLPLNGGGESYTDNDKTNIDGSMTILSDKFPGEHDNRQETHQENKMNKSITEDSETMLDISAQSPKPEFKTSGKDSRNRYVEIGPNQSRYQEKYQNYVQKTIQDFKVRHPNRIREYRNLSAEEKQQAQQHVIDLLARLGIGKNNGQKGDIICRQSQKIEAKLSLEESAILKSSPAGGSFCHVDSSPLDDTKFPFNDSDDVVGVEESNNESFGQAHDMHDYDSSGTTRFGVNMDGSDDSVELVRASERSYESPPHLGASASKRPASTSGKRGADTVRHKRDHEFSIERLEGNRSDSPDLRLSTGMQRLSLSPASFTQPKDLFVASQSPISPSLTQQSADSPGQFEIGETEIGWDACSDNESRFEDSLESGYASQMQYGKRKLLRELPVNVQLKPGARLHLNKLDVKHATPQKKQERRRKQSQQRYRLVNFPDPFKRYSEKQRSCLDSVYAYINRSDDDRNGSRHHLCLSSAVFSLSLEHVMSVTIKTLLDDCRSPSYEDFDSAGGKRGRTILIVRSKADIAQWESVLREGTGCSVLNHAILPLSERIRKSTAEKAAAHDVVITTFDALKSPDVAIPVDESGHAILGAVGTSKGWYSSRSSSQEDTTPQSCKQFSVLHRLEFERIIFVDVVGRKCFLGKEGTARAAAAIALRGESRYVTLTIFVSLLTAILTPIRIAQVNILSQIRSRRHVVPFSSSKMRQKGCSISRCCTSPGQL